ncbi:hypothetical protein ES705_21341 [subsurface metagenome]
MVGDVSKREAIIMQDKLKKIELENYETNFLKLAIFCVSRGDMGNRNKIEYSTKEEDKDGSIIEKKWRVLKNSESGGSWPGAFARKTFLAMQQKIGEILGEEGFVENPIYFKMYDLCKRMGIATGGSNPERIRDAIRLIQGLLFSSYGTYYIKSDGKYLGSIKEESNFNLIYGTKFKERKTPSGKTVIEDNKVWFNESFLDNLNEWYVAKIDGSYAMGLPPLASRLYEIFDLWFFAVRNKEDSPPFLQANYSNLCKQIPVLKRRYFSDAKIQFKSALDKLVKTEFLEKYHWSRVSKGNWLLKIWPGKRVNLEMAEKRRRYKRFQNTFGKE